MAGKGDGHGSRLGITSKEYADRLDRILKGESVPDSRAGDRVTPRSAEGDDVRDSTPLPIISEG